MGTRSKTPEEKLARRRKLWSEAFELVERGEASKQVSECVALVQEGCGIPKIATRLGLSKSTVGQYLRDPTGREAKARKAKRVRPCVDCGAPCNTDGSVSRPSKRCAPCATAHQKASAKWQQNAIIDAIRRWNSIHGRPPKAQEWGSGRYGHLDYLSGTWPAWNTVAYRFGSFNAAIRRAGYEPERQYGGQPRKPLTKEVLADTAALVEEFGLEKAAERLGMTIAGVKNRLKIHEGRKGKQSMPKLLTAETILERELAKVEAKAQSVRSELANLDMQAERLKVAKQALSEDPAPVPSA